MNETIMNEGIIYNDADVSANWQTLLFSILKTSGPKLTDDKADKYGFGNAILMRMMCTELIEFLHIAEASCFWKGSVELGNKFFQTMNEQDQ